MKLLETAKKNFCNNINAKGITDDIFSGKK